MNKVLAIDCQLDYAAYGPVDYLFNLEAAHHPWQAIQSEKLITTPEANTTHGLTHTGENRLIKINSHAQYFNVQYLAMVEVNYPLPTGNEMEMDIGNIPIEVIPYVWSSRYCESDALLSFALRTFGHLPRGYQRVQAICDWITQNVTYQVGETNSTTTSMNVLINRVGVCRDFAHLGITFCRALNIPARFVTGYTWYQTAPNDFHAIFEAYLGGRWVLFDATQLCPLTDFVRIATGRDAAETAFSTLFGNVTMTKMDPAVSVLS
jgi:transglutaminase-like putative cysteine protease